MTKPITILAIETSCDDTAISLLKAEGGFSEPKFKILSHQVSSQISIHKEWGGVVPMLAKREHGKNLTPMLLTTLKNSKLKVQSAKLQLKSQNLENKREQIDKLLEREPELREAFLAQILPLPVPEIDMIAVTEGPGLEPALWVGVNFAKALSLIWEKPIVPVNHMEGHIYSSLAENGEEINFPALALLVSGGHTELVLIKDWLHYEILGRTRDDAVGEAFDKVARILGLPYPGGPEISKLAKDGKLVPEFVLPRPMIKSDDYDFSFSGLKTAVLYLVKKIPELTPEIKASIAREFENSVVEVLTAKTRKAIFEHGPKTLIIGGGVSANLALRESFERLADDLPEVKLLLPSRKLSTDNATMIAIAAYFQFLSGRKREISTLQAQGNLSLN